MKTYSKEYKERILKLMKIVYGNTQEGRTTDVYTEAKELKVQLHHAGDVIKHCCVAIKKSHYKWSREDIPNQKIVDIVLLESSIRMSKYKRKSLDKNKNTTEVNDALSQLDEITSEQHPIEPINTVNIEKPKPIEEIVLKNITKENWDNKIGLFKKDKESTEKQLRIEAVEVLSSEPKEFSADIEVEKPVEKSVEKELVKEEPKPQEVKEVSILWGLFKSRRIIK